MKIFRGGLLVLALISTLAVNARGQAKFGVAAGINWAGLGDVDFGSITAAYESQQGWHAGVFADVKILFLGIKPGLFYVNAGPLLESGFLPDDLPIDITPYKDLLSFDVQWVSVPIDLKIGLPLVVAEPYVFLGPELKFMTIPADAGPIADNIESTVLAGNAGLGVAVNLGSISLYPEVRFIFDISGLFGDSVSIGGSDIAVDKHTAKGVMARIGVAL